MIYKQSRTKARRGFTLIETLLAIMILMLAITGPLTIANKGLTSSLIGKDRFIATYLAQDAMEYVRFVRDTNALYGVNWLTGVGTNWTTGLSPCYSVGGTTACYFDSLGNTPSVITSCANVDCSDVPLYYDTSSNSYSYKKTTGTTQTIFIRSVKITPVTNNTDEVLVSVTVTWKDVGNVLRTVVDKEDLFYWQ